MYMYVCRIIHLKSLVSAINEERIGIGQWAVCFSKLVVILKYNISIYCK